MIGSSLAAGLNMAEIVTLNGQSIEQAIEGNTPLAVLKDLVRQIEAGELALEAVLVIGEKTATDDESMIANTTWDSGLTVGHSVYMLETAKLCLMQVKFHD